MIHDLQTADAAIVKAELITGSDLYEAIADSRRDTVDAPNEELGYKLALGRALKALAGEILREANGMIRDQETERQIAILANADRNALKAERGAKARAEGLKLAKKEAKAKKKKK